MAISILVVGITVFIAHFFVMFARRTKVPDVLLLMLCGIVAGPILKLVSPMDFGAVGPVMSGIALIVILFEGGLSLDVKTVVSAATQTTLISFLSWVLTAIIAAAVMYLLTPVGLAMSLMTGAIVGGVSTAVVVPMLDVLHVSDRPRTVMFLESAVTDVLCIVVAYGIARGLSGGASSPGGIAAAVGMSFVLASIIGFVGALAWSMVLGWVRQFPNTIFASVAWIFILYGIAEILGLSGAIAALAAGITIANVGGRTIGVGRRSLELKPVGEVDQAFFRELVFLLKTFFFVYLGISIRFDKLEYILAAAIVVVVTYVMRFALVGLVGSRSYTRREAALMSVMVPKGLAAAVLASLPAQMALPNADWVSGIVYPIVLISIVLTSLMVILIENTPVRRVYDRMYARFAPEPSGDTPEPSGDTPEPSGNTPEPSGDSEES